MDKNKIIKDCIIKFKEVFPEVEIVNIKWNPKMRSSAGRIKFKYRIPYIIELNPHLLDNEEKLKKTLLHELAHLADAIIYNNISHGKTWKICMIKLGQNPDRTHNYDTSHLKRKMSRFDAKCSCKIHNISKIKHTKIRRGINYRCIKCKTRLELVN